MAQLETSEQIRQYLVDLGFTAQSTGGGFSAMFRERAVDAGRWTLMLTDWETDTAQLVPGKPFGLALYGPSETSSEVLFEVFAESSSLAGGIARFIREGEERFGVGREML